MALAELAALSRPNGNYQVEDSEGLNIRSGANLVHIEKPYAIKGKRSIYQSEIRELVRVEIQSRRPVRLEGLTESNRPPSPKLALYTVDALVLVSVIVVTVAFFTAMIDIPAGGTSLAAPSLFAIASFSIVGATSLKVRRSLNYFRKGTL